MKAAHQRYRARHLEQERQRDKDQAEAHKKAAKIRRSKNPEPYRKYQRSWQKANREKTRKYERTYREKHPEKFREKDQRRQSLNLGLPATFTGQDWIRALDYFGYRCAICGRPEGFWHILAQDHWIAQSNGGGYSPENIIPLCHAKKDGSDCCNNDKGSRDPVEWLMTTYNARKAKTIIQRITNYFEWINQHN